MLAVGPKKKEENQPLRRLLDLLPLGLQVVKKGRKEGQGRKDPQEREVHPFPSLTVRKQKKRIDGEEEKRIIREN